MPQFEYRALNPSGLLIAGHLEAVHQQDLVAQLSRLGLTLVRATEKRQSKSRGGAVSRRELILMFFHLEMLSRAGVPIPTAIADLRDSAEEPGLRELAAGLSERINNGETIAQAMGGYPKVFSPSVLNLIRAGEQSGELSKVLSELLRSLKWADELAAKTKKVMMYPAFVGTVILAVVFFLMIYLVPQMTSFIKNMGRELPMHTKALIATSAFIKGYWWAILTVPPGLGFGVAWLARTRPSVRKALDGLLLKAPVVGPIAKKIIMARIADTLGLMYSAGIPLLEAIGHCANVSANTVVKEHVNTVARRVAEGVGMASAFAEQGMFPPLVIRMMRIGESTGALDDALRNVSYFFNRDIDEAIGKVEAMIEPAMTVILGLILGWIMLSVMGPIYDVISTLKV